VLGRSPEQRARQLALTALALSAGAAACVALVLTIPCATGASLSGTSSCSYKWPPSSLEIERDARVALIRAEADLLEAAPAAYANVLRGAPGSENALRLTEPAKYAEWKEARRDLQAAYTRYGRDGGLSFVRYSKDRPPPPEGDAAAWLSVPRPVLAVGDAVPWRSAALAAANRRVAHAGAALLLAAPAEHAEARQRGTAAFNPVSGTKKLIVTTALLEAAPAETAAWWRAKADLLELSIAAYYDYGFADSRVD